MIQIIPGTYEIKSPRRGGYNDNIISVEVMDDTVRKMITYWMNPDCTNYGSEVYQGPNYVRPFNSKQKSYSRNYIRLQGIPKKYTSIVKKLMKKHEQVFPHNCDI